MMNVKRIKALSIDHRASFYWKYELIFWSFSNKYRNKTMTQQWNYRTSTRCHLYQNNRRLAGRKLEFQVHPGIILEMKFSGIAQEIQYCRDISAGR